MNIPDQIPIEAGSVYIMDRGYIDYQRLYHIHQHHALLVIQPKTICNVGILLTPLILLQESGVIKPFVWREEKPDVFIRNLFGEFIIMIPLQITIW